MQLTRTADYAVRVMIHLATLPAGSRVNRETLAHWAEVPGEFLGKVLQSLARARLITSHRGSQGGFELARPTAAINLLDIVEAIEGPTQLNMCLSGGEVCNRSWWCPADLVWRDVQEAMTSVLREATLDKMAEQAIAALSKPSLLELQAGGAATSPDRC